MERVTYGGWENCVRLVSGDLEMIVTTAVGPRVIRLGRIGGPNLFSEYARHAGMTGGAEYRSYGGHRFWTAPEIASRTYEADNQPVNVMEDEGTHHFTTALGPTKLEKTISVEAMDERQGFVLRHRVSNHSAESIEIAPWCISVMAPGGTCVFPQAPYKPHTDALLPARPTVTWHYTNMADPRWSWGPRVVRLKQTEDPKPQKAGAFVQQGYAAYWLGEDCFFKRFGAFDNEKYPDYGCNFEVYTRHDMLEVESLGYMRDLKPGDSTFQTESWYVISGKAMPDDEDELAEYLESLASSHPFSG